MADSREPMLVLAPDVLAAISGGAPSCCLLARRAAISNERSSGSFLSRVGEVLGIGAGVLGTVAGGFAINDHYADKEHRRKMELLEKQRLAAEQQPRS
jgi:hypothetical protein